MAAVFTRSFLSESTKRASRSPFCHSVWVGTTNINQVPSDFCRNLILPSLVVASGNTIRYPSNSGGMCFRWLWKRFAAPISMLASIPLTRPRLIKVLVSIRLSLAATASSSWQNLLPILKYSPITSHRNSGATFEEGGVGGGDFFARLLDIFLPHPFSLGEKSRSLSSVHTKLGIVKIKYLIALY